MRQGRRQVRPLRRQERVLLSDQKEPEKFAGQKVKITGTYNEATKILQVDSMVAAGK